MFGGVKCPVTARTGVPALVRKLVGDELIRSVWTTERARLGVQTGWKSGSYSIAEFPQICDIEPEPKYDDMRYFRPKYRKYLVLSVCCS